MEELKTILEENEDLIRAAQSLEELCTLLKQKGIDTSVEALEALCHTDGTAALSDDELDGVAGGVSPLGALYLLRGGVQGSRQEAVTLEHRPGSPIYATTMEFRTDKPIYASTLEVRGAPGAAVRTLEELTTGDAARTGLRSMPL